MTKKQSAPAITKQAKKSAAELSEKELNQASGGAYDAFMPTDQKARTDKSGVTDGTLNSNSALIGLLKKP